MAEFGDEEFGAQSFWRKVQELVVAQDAVLQGGNDLVVLHAGIDGSGLYAQLAQASHLVLHQCYEWSYHYTGTFHGKCRYLEGYTLTASRRHKAKGILARDNAVYYLALYATE